jgi:arginase
MKNLFIMTVPQWQGSAAGTAPYHGAKSMAKMVGSDIIDAEIAVREQSVAKRIDGVWYLHEIVKHYNDILTVLDEHRPRKLLTLGGDCSSDVITISYLNKIYDGDMVVLWLDAHANISTPESSKTGKCNGMPLRILLGEGSSKILELLPTVLNTDQVVYTGLRSVEHPERQFIVNHAIPNAPVSSSCFNMLESILQRTNKKHVYIHIGLDVIDPLEFDAVGYPFPGGILYEDLLVTLEQIGKEFSVVGSSVTEYDPTGDDSKAKLERLLNVVKGMFD